MECLREVYFGPRIVLIIDVLDSLNEPSQSFERETFVDFVDLDPFIPRPFGTGLVLEWNLANKKCTGALAIIIRGTNDW